MIPRKQRASQHDWLEAVEAIYSAPDLARARRLVETARERVDRRLRHAENPVLAWSGGKDSLGVEVVVEPWGLPSIISLTALEYPAFLREMSAIAPPRLSVSMQDHLNMDWLAAHPQHLFPTTADAASAWFNRVQRVGNRRAVLAGGHDLLIVGQRTADGNQCGRVTDTGAERMDRGGFVRFAPIYDWSHEDLLHVLAAAGKPIPSFYFWPRGFRVGTGPWPARRSDSIWHGWTETYMIDPSLVVAAAERGLPEAADFLRHLENR